MSAPLERDRFGLPRRVGALLMLTETSEKRSKRIAEVHAFVEEAWLTVRSHLGEDEAKIAFMKATKRKRGQHGGRKKLFELRDYTLLKEYDAQVRRSPKDKSSAARVVAERLFSDRGTEVGASAQAVQKQLRRLLKEREQRKARRAARLHE